MATSIKCWLVGQDSPPHELEIGNPALEENLEDWIEECVELVDPSLLIIGRQVKGIDLLAIDEDGQLVIIELKRDKLTRDAVAQALDYTSMVADWTPERIVNIANDYLSKSSQSIHDAFEECFKKSLDDTGGINSDQRILLVGCRADPSLERVVDWLSDRGIPINVVTLSFCTLPDGQNILVRTLLISEERAKAQSDQSRGRRPPMSEDAISEAIAERHLKELLTPFKALDQLTALTRMPGVDDIDYEVRIPRLEGPPLRRKAVQILLGRSKPGRLRIGIMTNNLAKFLEVGEEEVLNALPKMKWDPKVAWRLEADLRSLEECRELAEAIIQLLERSPV